MSGESDESASVELNLTTTRVSYLNLRLGHPGRKPASPTWRRVRTRIPSRGQTRLAQLARNFRFAVIAAPGPNLCVEKVRAFDRKGRLLEARSVPCEY